MERGGRIEGCGGKWGVYLCPWGVIVCESVYRDGAVQPSSGSEDTGSSESLSLEALQRGSLNLSLFTPPPQAQCLLVI